MKQLNKQKMIDLLYGCTVLGTGGGGNLTEGIDMLKEAFEEGKELKLISLDEIPDDAYVATPYGCGAPSEEGAEIAEEYKDLPQIGYPSSMLAYKKLEEYFQKDFYAISATELGGLNTAEALNIALSLDLPLIDGDPAGRSVPELQHTTYFVKDIPIYPMAVATDFGDVVIIENAVDDFRAEKIVRAIAVASGDIVGVADHPILGKDIKGAVIEGSISYALKIGEALRLAKENKEDVPAAVAKAGGGKVVFKGDLEKSPWESRDGFNYGEIHLTGKDEYNGNKYEIWFKNENIMGYLNDEVHVTAPDLICMLDKDGEPLCTPNFEEGMEITIVVLPSPKIWQTEKGIECFGPRHFGFDMDYKPFF
ncbi:MAG: DUF917 domain-containing protein [Clostridiales bacterium]|nr:DUF917 domain-containing protein [Clostridiales bacterium]